MASSPQDRKASQDSKASASTKRAARLAQKGKGKRVRFQGGTLFPVVILLIIVVGLATVVYAKASQPIQRAVPHPLGAGWPAKRSAIQLTAAYAPS